MPLPQDSGIIPDTPDSLAQYANDQFNARASGVLEDRIATLEALVQQMQFMLTPTATLAAAALASLPAHKDTHKHGGSDAFLPGATSILPGDVIDGSARFGVANDTFSPGAAPAAQTSPLYLPKLTFAGVELFGYDQTIAFGVTESSGGTAVYARYLKPTPFYTLKGYIDSARGTGDHIDSTYFDAGVNVPVGITQFQASYYAQGPGGSILIMGSVDFALWFRIGVKNNTGSNIVGNWFVPYVDNGCTIIWDGATLFNKATTDGSLSNNSGTMTVNANSSGFLDLFFFNVQSAPPIDGANPSIFNVFLDIFEKAGITFY